MRTSASKLLYRPVDPERYRPAIGLIGCGDITKHHLEAYRAAGYTVSALCDLDKRRAEAQRTEFYPDADVYTDHRDVLAREDISVVDITTHPAERVALIEDAIAARKHILSQKPFALDLDVGRRLNNLATDTGVKLAVNQNLRWAPHVAYLRAAVAAGLLGELTSVQMVVNFDHSWVVRTPFDRILDLVLYDYAIHWFDALQCFAGPARAERVAAFTGYAAGQIPTPPMLASAIFDFPAMQATLSFNGSTRIGTESRITLIGTAGAAISYGPTDREQQVEIITSEGIATPELQGSWFPDGFHGTMAELLLAIEEDRAPSNSAANNLIGLELAFAAIGSAHDGTPKEPGEVTRLPAMERQIP